MATGVSIVLRAVDSPKHVVQLFAGLIAQVAGASWREGSGSLCLAGEPELVSTANCVTNE
jgi:hypothetical protein